MVLWCNGVMVGGGEGGEDGGDVGGGDVGGGDVGGNVGGWCDDVMVLWSAAAKVATAKVAMSVDGVMV